MKGLKRVHIVGACGTLMGAFAAYLKKSGTSVTGSDENVYPPMSDLLRSLDIPIFTGYKAENISGLRERPDMVVIGNVIRRDNPEARFAIDNGYPYTSLPEYMEKFLLPATRNLVVAGTHGKTTSSSLLAQTLSYLKQKPSYFIGGVSLDLPQSFQIEPPRSGQESYFVLEGDEYDTAFWDKVPKFNHYLPNDAILTSVEFDHADIYADLAAVEKAFEGLISRIRPNGSQPGRLIACADYPTMRPRIEQALARGIDVVTYGMGSTALTVAGKRVPHYQAKSFDLNTPMPRCEVWLHGADGPSKVGEFRIQIPGEYNVVNALGVWIECRGLGFSTAAVAEGLASFKGVRRRQEVRGEPRGVTVIDDFAHHPTAVKVTLEALKRKYSGRRLIAVFEPRSATSRRAIFQQAYTEAFGPADCVFISAPYDQARIEESNRFSSDKLVSDLKKGGALAEVIHSADEGVEKVAALAKSGDVVAVLSNGGFGGFIPKLIQKIGS